MATPAERLFAVACAAMFVFGIMLSLPGTVLGLPETAAELDLSLADRGLLIATLFGGLLVGSLLSGRVVGRLGQRTTLAASAACVAACLPLFALSSSVMTAAASLGALGLACAGMNTASNALASDLFPDERGRRMNVIALIVGTGGLALPATIALTAGVASWRAVIYGAAAAAALAAGAAFRVSEPTRHEVPTGAASFTDFARRPRFVWFGLAIMIAAGTEASMAGWTSTYLGIEGVAPSAATWALSAHWLGLVIGRIAFSGRIERAKGAAIVRGALAGAACVAVLVLARDTRVLALAPFAVGIAIAVVVPTTLAVAGERFPGHAGTLFGMLLTLAQVGGIAMPALIGVVAERAGVRVGLSMLILNGAAVAIVVHRGMKPE